MAVIAPTPSTQPRDGVITWTPIANADTCTAIAPKGQAAAFATFQVSGTFGGATVTLEGSNNGTAFATLKDVNGTAVSLTAAGLVEVSTAAAHLRPAISGGTASSVTASLSLRG